MLVCFQGFHRLAIILAAFVWLAGAADIASAGAPSFSEMSHKTWTARDGAPQGAIALAQTADGILWVGGETGLSSFDGRIFTPFQARPGEPDLPAGPVESVLAARNGDLWVGFRASGIARVRNGRVRLFSSSDPPLQRIQHIQQSSDGAIWALNRQQEIVRFSNDGSWHEEPTPLGVQGGRIRDIFIDSSNTLWVAQGGRLYRRPLHQGKYLATGAAADWIFGIAEAPDHSLWMADTITDAPSGPVGRIQHIDPDGSVIARLPETDNAEALLYEPDGSIVMTVYSVGLLKFPAQALTGPTPAAAQVPRERYGPKDGLASAPAYDLLRDHDGNLWVAGMRGLDRFRTARLIAFDHGSGMTDPQLCAGRNGDVWISATDDAGNTLFYKLSGSVRQSVPIDGQILSQFCGADGDIWLAMSAGVSNIHAGHITALPPIPGMRAFGLHQVVATADDVAYASVSGSPNVTGIWRYAGGSWTKLPGPSGSSAPPTTLYLDSHSRLWAAYPDGVIALPLEGARPIPFSGTPEPGQIYVLLETSHGMFAGGLNGLAVLRNGRFEMLSFADRLSTLGIGGLVESNNGDLWLNATHGIVHVRGEDLLAALRDPRRQMKSELLTEGNFVGPADLWAGKSTAGRDKDGNVWFATLNGVFHIDPAHVNSGIQPPILSIRSMSADQKPVSDGGRIDPGPQTLDIQYLGVNLTTPERVIYQYRLDGLDNSWQDAGHRTEAIYTHLRPGKYIFRVMASNGDGVWTPTASANFKVLPYFYQTTWFLLLCVLACVLLLWFGFSVRLQVIASEIRARAEERADERIRISRDLHDTLLQGVHGLLLTFDAAAQKITADEESREILERAMSAADRIIIEGRNKVSKLRSDQMKDAELVGALEKIGDDIEHAAPIELRVQREGIDAALHPHVADEAFSMAREAITNAFRHSGASEIQIALTYGSRRFSLLCRDNGCGFSAVDADKPGHWGLKGMRERALKLGGELRIQSEPARGTEIVLTIPASRAYVNHSRFAFFLRIPFYARQNTAVS